jgi:dihydropteroate synthase
MDRSSHSFSMAGWTDAGAQPRVRLRWKPVIDSSLFRGAHTLIMGVVNVTPDSFSDGGSYFDAGRALAHASTLIEEGADILDIGGESSRPGSDPVSVEEELRRVVPVMRAMAGVCGVPLSIDTTKPDVAEECLRLGARIVNDIAGLRDPEMVRVTVRHNASAVIMHMRGTPKTMQSEPVYEDVIGEVKQFLAERVAAARAAGVRDISVDPGIGFGKTVAHNFEILRRLDEFQDIGCPVLVGPSRKAFLGSFQGQQDAIGRLEGTLAAVVIAALKGASVVRVHDVAACRRALQVADAVRQL